MTSYDSSNSLNIVLRFPSTIGSMLKTVPRSCKTKMGDLRKSAASVARTTCDTKRLGGHRSFRVVSARLINEWRRFRIVLVLVVSGTPAGREKVPIWGGKQCSRSLMCWSSSSEELSVMVWWAPLNGPRGMEELLSKSTLFPECAASCGDPGGQLRGIYRLVDGYGGLASLLEPSPHHVLVQGCPLLGGALSLTLALVRRPWDWKPHRGESLDTLQIQ